VSLILEALKKLERDKQVSDKGFLVMAASPWPGAPTSRLVWASLTLGALGVVGLAGAGAWWWWHRTGGEPGGPPARQGSVPPGNARAEHLSLPLVSDGAPPVAPPRGRSPMPTGTNTAAIVPLREGSRPAPPPQELSSREKAPPSDTEGTHGVTGVPNPQPPQPPETRGGGTGAATIRLAAISERDGRPVAIINDRMLFEGDTVDGMKVLHIGENEVELELNGRRQVVHF